MNWLLVVVLIIYPSWVEPFSLLVILILVSGFSMQDHLADEKTKIKNENQNIICNDDDLNSLRCCDPTTYKNQEDCLREINYHVKI